MQTELKNIVRKQKLPASITAGLGGVFVALADRFLKEGGRLAFVLPAALATGEAWAETRALINRSYHLEYVVMSHDANRWSFSENTDLSELLFVARKLLPNETTDGCNTTFVNLWRNPENIGDALAVARLACANNPAPLGTATQPGGVRRLVELDEEYGEAISVPSSVIGNAWWPGAFAQTHLVRAAFFLTGGSLCVPGHLPVSIPITTVGKLATIGPDRRDIHDGFSVQSHHSPYPAYWNHDAEGDVSLAAKPNAWLSPLATAHKGRNLRKVSDLWPKAGRLLIVERLRLTSQKLAALFLSEPVLSNTWWVLRLINEDPRRYKALALWLNSTLGLLTILLSRVPTEGPWLQLKKPALTAMSVLNVDQLSEAQLDQLSVTFDNISHVQLKAFKDMDTDVGRADIDDALSKILQLPDLRQLRSMLGHEAIVTGKPMLKPRKKIEAVDTSQLALEGI